MNYIKELNAFYDWLESNPCPSDAIALWQALLAVCNKAGWPKEFTAANSTLQTKAGLSRVKLDRWRGFLKDKGLILYKKSDKVNEAGRYTLIPFCPIVQNDTQNDIQNDTRNDTQNDIQDVTQDDTQNEHINKDKLNINETKTKKDIIPFAEIVGYLNQRAKTSYTHTAKATQSHIRARWSEGYRLDSFKKVIDNKADEWASDPKMAQYLRPQTLFGTKFESYLNSKVVNLRDKPRTSHPRGSGEYDFLSQ